MKHKVQWIAALLSLMLLFSLIPARGYAMDDIIDLIEVEEPGDPIEPTDPYDGEIVLVEEPDLSAAEDWVDELRPFSGPYGWLQLQIDPSLLEQVGHQRGGQACACFSQAYCRTILDGESHPWMEYNLGTSGEDALCDWSIGAYTSGFYTHASDVYEKIYDELCAGRPCVILIKGPNTAHHYIAVVGFENVVSGEPLTPSNFLILDPCAQDYQPINMGYMGFTLKRLPGGSYQLVCAADGSFAEREAHRSSYLSRCSVYPCARTVSDCRNMSLFTLPCSVMADRESRFERIPNGESFSVNALIKNPDGEYWYRGVSSSGQIGYFYSGRQVEWEEDCIGASTLDLCLPALEEQGKAAVLSGRVFSGLLPGSSVRCAVYAGIDTESEPLLCAERFGAFYDLDLAASGLLDASQLRALDEGCYTLVISVSCSNYACENGKTLQSRETETVVAELSFSTFASERIGQLPIEPDLRDVEPEVLSSD